ARTPNSSPPRRATTSAARRGEAITWAARRRSPSPASWPARALTPCRSELAQATDLFAAQAGDDVRGPPGGVDHLGGAAQQPVAGVVAVAVVDPLELVQVDRDQGRRRAVRAGGGRHPPA